MQSIPDVSWNRVAAFVRQHAHDLRNDLNGLDLDATLLADLVTDAETSAGVKRMRAGIRKLAADLRALGDQVADPRPAPRRVPARELFELWQEAGAGGDVEWTNGLGGECVNVDPGDVGWVFEELRANAAASRSAGKMRAVARVSGGNVIFELREPKTHPIDTARWGEAPFASIRPGHYGLGLFALVQTIAANGGSIDWSFADPTSELVTTIRFAVVE